MRGRQVQSSLSSPGCWAAFSAVRLGQSPTPCSPLAIRAYTHFTSPQGQGSDPFSGFLGRSLSLGQDCVSFSRPSGQELPLPASPPGQAGPRPSPLALLCLGRPGGVDSLANHGQTAPGSSHHLPQLLWTPDTAGRRLPWVRAQCPGPVSQAAVGISGAGGPWG